MESESECDIFEDEDLEQISLLEIEPSKAEAVLDFSLDLTKESLFNLIKDSKNSFFRLFSIAKLNTNNLDEAKAKIEFIVNNLRKKNCQSTQNKTEYTQRSPLSYIDREPEIAAMKDCDFNNLSNDLSDQLFVNKNEIISRVKENDFFENKNYQDNIDIERKESKTEDDFNLINSLSF